MNGWRNTIVPGIAGCVLTLLSCLPARCSTFVDPLYMGRALSGWLLELDASPSSDEIMAALKQGLDSGQAYEKKKHRDEAAIRQIGTNGLALLLEIVGAKAATVTDVVSKLTDQRFAEMLQSEKLELDDFRRMAVDGFEILGAAAEPAIPRLDELLHDPETSLQAARALCKIGPRGFVVLTNALSEAAIRNDVVWVVGQEGKADLKVITQLLIGCLKDKDPIVRGNAAEFLSGKDADLAIPALIGVLDDYEFYPRSNAAGALASFGAAAKQAAPKLLSVYTNVIAGNDKELARTLGIILQDALQKIDPEATAKAEAILIASSPVNSARYGHTTTVLSDGRILFVGGYLHTSTTNRFLDSADIQDPVTGKWSATGLLNVARNSHTATLLPDGRVLVAGGTDPKGAALAGVELYDPKTGKWTLATPLNTARFYHTAGLQLDGTVVVAGGHTGHERIETTESYDSVKGTWTAGPDIAKLVPAVRSGHTATLLKSGKILVAGGDAIGSVELYDSATATWTNVGSLHTPRMGHTSTVLKDGSVLVVGGNGKGAYLSSVEIFELATGKWTPVGPLSTPAIGHTATLLSDGRVLVAGGEASSGPLARAEWFDPATHKWMTAQPMKTKRSSHTATLLPNGKVLAVGGKDSQFGVLSSAEVYDPATGRWTDTDELNVARWRHTATSLSNGKVIIAGGSGESFDPVSATELYDPATGKWTGTGQMNVGRYDHAATLLANGDVLVSGSDTRDAATTAEVYSAATEKWTMARAFVVERRGHTATLLPDRKVLLLGGDAANRVEFYSPGVTPASP